MGFRRERGIPLTAALTWSSGETSRTEPGSPLPASLEVLTGVILTDLFGITDLTMTDLALIGQLF